jgi:hypothetical protein
MALITFAQFKTASLMPSEDVDDLETRYPGYVAKRIALREGRMNARLAKALSGAVRSRRARPTWPIDWLVAQVTLDCYLKRGFNPSSAQDQLIEKEATTAADGDPRGRRRGRREVRAPAPPGQPRARAPCRRADPFGHSENNPYAAFDVQADDIRGGGS